MKLVKLALLLILVVPGVMAQVESTYNVVIKPSGESVVILGLEGSGTLHLPLPDDAEPVIKGAVGIPEEGGYAVSLVESGVVVYRTHEYTVKRGPSWNFRMTAIPESKVLLSLPDRVEIINTSHQPHIRTGEITQIVWDQHDGHPSAAYEFREPVPEREENGLWLMVLFVLLFVVLTGGGVAFMWYRSRESKQSSVMKALSENEQLITQVLLDHNGEMKRNKLEKRTRLAKSSLAVALNNLEKKNVVEIDKSHVVHYVMLTDWFKSL